MSRVPAAPPPASVFEWLHGGWTFTRVVPEQAQMTGSATISGLDCDSSIYIERAKIVLAEGKTLFGERSYFYRRQNTGLDILFYPSLTLFQALHFEEGIDGTLYAEARHDCLDDVYDSRYRIDSDNLEVWHSIRGPRKNYTIHTVYTKSA